MARKWMRRRSRAYRRTPQRLSHGLEQAQRLVGQGLKAAGLDRQDLKALPGSDARKVALAKFLRERTTVSLEWVARALCMGGAANVGHYVRTRLW